MKQFELLNKKQKIILIAILIFIFAIIIYYFYIQYQAIEIDSQEINQEEKENAVNTIEETIQEDKNEIIIHVSGAVANEGIIKIKQGARISDVIDAAGGLKENASLKNVNLAYIVEDAQKIYIPTQEEEQEIEKEYSIIQEGNNSSEININKEEEKVNINKATQTELEELPGIGSATALKIIEYRKENGEFKSVEDIKNVNGIGEAKFNNIKEYIEI